MMPNVTKKKKTVTRSTRPRGIVEFMHKVRVSAHFIKNYEQEYKFLNYL